jgi:RNA polymerase sigma factor (sigma-70 family)
LLLQAERFVSLDVPVGEDEAFLAVYGVASSAGGEQQNRSRVHRWLRQVVDGLPERERQVITLRYGFDRDQEHTTREVADVLNLSHDLVQEIDRRVRLRISVAMERCGIEYGVAGSVA